LVQRTTRRSFCYTGVEITLSNKGVKITRAYLSGIYINIRSLYILGHAEP